MVWKLANVADIGKSIGPRSSTGDNSGGPMKTLVVPVWDDILTPLYIDPGVNISYDILTPGSIYRTTFWPRGQYKKLQERR